MVIFRHARGEEAVQVEVEPVSTDSDEDRSKYQRVGKDGLSRAPKDTNRYARIGGAGPKIGKHKKNRHGSSSSSCAIGGDNGRKRDRDGHSSGVLLCNVPPTANSFVVFVPQDENGIALTVDSPFLLAKVMEVNDDIANNLSPVKRRRWLYRLRWYRVLRSPATHKLQKYVLYFPEPVAKLQAKEERVLGADEAQQVLDTWKHELKNRAGGWKKKDDPEPKEVGSTFYFYEADERFKIVLASLEWVGKLQGTQSLSSKSFKLLTQCAPDNVRELMLEGAAPKEGAAPDLSESEGGGFSGDGSGDDCLVNAYASDVSEEW
jgi:hypothetical protein